MPLPQDWTTENILIMAFSRLLSNPKLISAVEKFHSFGAFLKTESGLELKRRLENKQLFPDSGSDIMSEVQKQLEICEEKDYRIVSYWDENYPELLRKISHPPAVLYVKGTLQKSDSAIISIVGTRSCTTYGKLTAERFAEAFTRNGIVLGSGLARGIDTTSHLAALRAGGITYAVIASGLDCISPDISNKNADRIVAGGGAIISEYPCGVKARPGYFPVRNRIISGISKAVLVIESAAKGGSLITAKFAHNDGREVFAVPGNISSRKSEGTNYLIKKNIAIPALTPEGMLEDLGFAKEYYDQIPKDGPRIEDKEEKLIYDTLSLEPMHIDILADKCELDVSVMLVKLLNLEFAGIIKQLPGKHYIRTN